jgi:hypothetical protein
MFVIVVTGLDGTQTKLASVEHNPEPIAKAARLKRMRVGTRTIRRYLKVEISEVKREAADAISEAGDEH